MAKTITFEEVSSEINALTLAEDRVIAAISFMREAISSEGKPRFRDFWRMKKNCFELFGAIDNPIKKTFFWKEYSELLSEAHRLQEIFRQEIEFHSEQIGLAISGLEAEIADQEKAKAIEIPQFNRFPELKELEQRARFLESLKAKVLALREEILGLEIRVHQKNELLEILKKLGDQVFPEYKKIVVELTEAFQRRVDLFFTKMTGVQDNALLKRDIRQFQSVLKEIHISHDSYRQFREKFSEAWKITETQKPVKEVRVREVPKVAPSEERASASLEIWEKEFQHALKGIK